MIPTRIRKQAGLSGGDALVVWVEDDRIVLRRREQVEEELWRQFEGVKKSLSSDLIADRRKEARREAKQKRL
ncbi:MAG: AbrB family transcriptional regulator [Nitrospirae bacterium]|nr:AbrB family transcriptional regulator [Nitrospirota bacterium]MBI3392785.1 AbrB family transcriptional regulator [Nitrospirota bacterium]